MSTQLEELLSRLEELSTQAVDSSDPALHPSVDTVGILEFIRERGSLIEQLRPVLAAHSPVSYVEWNRLIVIHHQGARILENVNHVRSRVAFELGSNASGRHFLERVNSMLPPASNEA